MKKMDVCVLVTQGTAKERLQTAFPYVLLANAAYARNEKVIIREQQPPPPPNTHTPLLPTRITIGQDNFLMVGHVKHYLSCRQLPFFLLSMEVASLQ